MQTTVSLQADLFFNKSDHSVSKPKSFSSRASKRKFVQFNDTKAPAGWTQQQAL